MDHVEVRDLKNWVTQQLGGCQGVVVGFSGSYCSAVGMTLLQKSFGGLLLPVRVSVKEDSWKLDLAATWLRKIGSKYALKKVILDETLDDLEDAIKGLRKKRDIFRKDMEKMGLEAVARATGWPIAWLGDRNSVAFHGLPISDIPYLTPLSHLSQARVRKLGAVLSVSDEWLLDWDGVPSRWYSSECARAQKVDKVIGWAQAHREDLIEAEDPEEWSSAIYGSPGQTFRWMGWVPEDSSDRVLLGEIVEDIKEGGRKKATEFGDSEGVLLLGSEYRMSLSGSPPKKIPLLGSIRAQPDPSVGGVNRLLVSGVDDQSRKVSVGIVMPTEQLCVQVLEKLQPHSQFRLPVCLQGDEESLWYIFSFSEKGLQSFKGALEDLLSWIAILPEDVTHEPLTEEEKQERVQRSKKLAAAPRPTSRRS